MALATVIFKNHGIRGVVGFVLKTKLHSKWDITCRQCVEVLMPGAIMPENLDEIIDEKCKELWMEA